MKELKADIFGLEKSPLNVLKSELPSNLETLLREQIIDKFL